MNKKIVVGRFGKTHGFRGWLRVLSFTESREDIASFVPWLINRHERWQEVDVEGSQAFGNGVLVKLKGVDNCELAKEYTNLDIAIDRCQLPELPSKRYYWSDLEGLMVLDTFGKELGIVDSLFATGANDVLVVKNGNKKLLVPYVKDVIAKVDLGNKLIKVDYEF